VNVSSLWEEYETNGEFTVPPKLGGQYVTGAAAGSVNLGPGETKEVTIILGWYFPDRDFLGLPVGRFVKMHYMVTWNYTVKHMFLSGNFYANLFKDSVDAAHQLGGNLSTVVSEITNLHTPFLKSTLPTTLQDMLINSLSHVR
jgi:uncharacterized protein (DUF608 family)